MKKSKANSSGPAAEQGYWLRMSHAPEAGESSNVASMLPVMLFGALVILIVHAFLCEHKCFHMLGIARSYHVNSIFVHIAYTLHLSCDI